MRVEWLPRALINLADQLVYVGQRNPAAASGLADAVKAATAQIGEFPCSGRAGRLPGTRELVVTGTPFIVVYRVNPAGVVIVRMLHAARRWP